jgi:hypothetical protein
MAVERHHRASRAEAARRDKGVAATARVTPRTQSSQASPQIKAAGRHVHRRRAADDFGQFPT